MNSSAIEASEASNPLWNKFWKLGDARANVSEIHARVILTHPGTPNNRQFVVETGSGHHFLIDDTTGHTGPKPIELVAVALAGCTAFDVITILRNKNRQDVTGYEVRVEAEQAERSPQKFVAVRIHHIVSGRNIDPAAVSEAIRISEEKYCSVEAMLKDSAVVRTTFGVLDEDGS
jgi:putative redox protein